MAADCIAPRLRHYAAGLLRYSEQSHIVPAASISLINALLFTSTSLPGYAMLPNDNCHLSIIFAVILFIIIRNRLKDRLVRLLRIRDFNSRRFHRNCWIVGSILCNQFAIAVIAIVDQLIVVEMTQSPSRDFAHSLEEWKKGLNAWNKFAKIVRPEGHAWLKSTLRRNSVLSSERERERERKREKQSSPMKFQRTDRTTDTCHGGRVKR